jgi:Holliday junction DNA helicase RuvB
MPQAFHDFVGQRRAIAFVRRLIQGAKASAKACPSLLLIGRSGTGKTALARATAREYGTDLKPLFAGPDTRPVDVCTALAACNFADFLFIDEAHALRGDTQEILYQALDDCKVPGVKEGRLDRGQSQSVAQVTLIAATNQPGRLRPALRGRLRPVEFVPYTLRELVAIAKRAAAEEKVELTSQAARRLAETAQGLPGRVQQRLEALQLFWPGVSCFGQQHVESLLRHEGVDALGLTPSQRRYLRLLAASPRGAPLKGMAARLGLDVAFVEQEVELYLLDKGLVEVTGAGRKITTAGKSVFDKPDAEKAGGAKGVAT